MNEAKEFQQVAESWKGSLILTQIYQRYKSFAATDTVYFITLLSILYSPIQPIK